MNPNNKSANPNNIKVLMQKRGLNASEIARQLNISHTAVGRWERGETMPQSTTMPLLAKILRCKIDDLFCHV